MSVAGSWTSTRCATTSTHRPVTRLSQASLRARCLGVRRRGRHECRWSGRVRCRRLGGGANTLHLAAQVGIYTPPLLAHHVRFTFAVDGSGWQSWIDKPAAGLSTYQHEAGPGRWAVGGQVDPAELAWERGRESAIAASGRVIANYAARYLTVRPEIVDSLYCTTVPNLGNGVEFRRNGPILAVYGDNLMKFAPVLGEALAEAAVSGTAPSIASMIQDRT